MKSNDLIVRARNGDKEAFNRFDIRISRNII